MAASLAWSFLQHCGLPRWMSLFREFAVFHSFRVQYLPALVFSLVGKINFMLVCKDPCLGNLCYLSSSSSYYFLPLLQNVRFLVCLLFCDPALMDRSCFPKFSPVSSTHDGLSLLLSPSWPAMRQRDEIAQLITQPFHDQRFGNMSISLII